MNGEQIHRKAYAPKASSTHEGPFEPLCGAYILAHGFGNNDSAGARSAGNAARDVNRTAVPVARMADRPAGGEPDPEPWEVVRGRSGNRIKNHIQQRHGIGALDVNADTILHHPVPADSRSSACPVTDSTVCHR